MELKPSKVSPLGGKASGGSSAQYDSGHSGRSGFLASLQSTDPEQKLLIKLQESETRLQESEALLRATLENAPVGIGTSDLEGRLLTVNHALCALVGYTAEELLQMTTRQITHPDDLEKTIQLQEALIEGKMESYRIEKRYLHKNGQSIEAIVRVAVIRDASGAPKRFVGEIEDLRETKKLEAEILRASKLESIGLLAGGIAHDFNNLLTGILGNLSLAKWELTGTPGIFPRLLEAERATLKARDLTRQLLTFAKGGEPIRRAVAISELIRESSGLVLRGTNCRACLDIPNDLWPVFVDSVQIGQVFHNLLINAVQAMPNGGKLEIRCRNLLLDNGSKSGLMGTLEPGKYAQITIIDHGTGIKPQDLTRVFDPYFTTKPNGTGLGLSTTYSIIRRHQGHVAVSSTLGLGTSFTIILPACEQEVERVKEGDTMPILGSGRILIMDDEELVRETAGDMLETLGYDVTLSEDGADALRIYQAAKASGHPFQAVIMDLTIPGGMGGKEAVQKLLEIDPEACAIVSSGYSDDPVVANYIAYGFRGVVSKPYLLSTLSGTLAELHKNKPSSGKNR